VVHAAIPSGACFAAAEEVVVQRHGGHQPQKAQQRPRDPAQRDVESRREGQGAPLRQRPQVDAPPAAARVQQGTLQPVMAMAMSETCCREHPIRPAGGCRTDGSRQCCHRSGHRMRHDSPHNGC
jgi:hypothetical protein